MALYTTRQSLQSLCSQPQNLCPPSQDLQSHSDITNSGLGEYRPTRLSQPEQKYSLVDPVVVSQPGTSADGYPYDLPQLALNAPHAPQYFVPPRETLVSTNNPDKTKDLLTCTALENHPTRTWYDPVDHCFRPPISANPFPGLVCNVHQENHTFLESRYGHRSLETQQFFQDGNLTAEPDTCLSRGSEFIYMYQCGLDTQRKGADLKGIEMQGRAWTRVSISNIGTGWCKSHDQPEPFYESVFRREQERPTGNEPTHDQLLLNTHDTQSVTVQNTGP